MSTHGSNIQDKLTPRLSACAQDTYRLLGVLEEDLCAVRNLKLVLCCRSRAVNATVQRVGVSKASRAGGPEGDEPGGLGGIA